MTKIIARLILALLGLGMLGLMFAASIQEFGTTLGILTVLGIFLACGVFFWALYNSVD